MGLEFITLDKKVNRQNEKARRHNSGLAKVAVQYSSDTFVVNQIWFSASIPIAIEMVKIANFL